MVYIGVFLSCVLFVSAETQIPLTGSDTKTVDKRHYNREHDHYNSHDQDVYMRHDYGSSETSGCTERRCQEKHGINSICDLGKNECECKKDYTMMHGHCEYHYQCRTDDCQELHGPNSGCTDTLKYGPQCVCEVGFYFNGDHQCVEGISGTTQCIPGIDDFKCHAKSHGSFCHPIWKRCICEYGKDLGDSFFPAENVQDWTIVPCVKKESAVTACSSDTFCTNSVLVGQECRDGLCQCPKGKALQIDCTSCDEQVATCIEAPGLAGDCKQFTSDPCETKTPYSYCSPSTKTCECLHGLYDEDNISAGCKKSSKSSSTESDSNSRERYYGDESRYFKHHAHHYTPGEDAHRGHYGHEN